MNNHTPTIPEYSSFPMDTNTALIAIDSGTNPYENPGQHAHIRFPKIRPGEVLKLGPAPGRSCSVYKVLPNDLIGVRQWNGRSECKKFYEVLADFSLRIHEPGDKNYYRISNYPTRFQHPQGGNLAVKEEDLEILFSSQWPSWLRPILDAQLIQWRTHHVDHYFHYTPQNLRSQNDLWSCIKGAAFQAVRRFGRRLSGNQRSICFDRSPKARAVFAISSLAHETRAKALEEHPEELIRYTMGDLTDTEVRRVSTLKPEAVFRHCHQMPDWHRALALSAALRISQSRIPEFQGSINTLLMRTLTDFPEVWFSEFDGEFHSALGTWDTVLGYKPTGTDMMNMLQKLDTRYKPSFVKAMTRRV